MNKKIELLAPAGSLLKLKVAVTYGADAVYCAGKKFGLRTASDNFTTEELKEGLKFAHDRGVKLYVTLNTYPRNDEIREIKNYIKELSDIGVDAVIVSDLGVFDLVRKTAPQLEIHVSTQANTVNFLTAAKWYELGAKRIVLARELSLAEIKDLRANTPKDLDIECFVHGAMCISYSGRCLLSNYMTGRDSNRGDCAQPCRWKYFLMEEKREGQYFPVYEDEKGTFIMNSKDLCLIRRIPDLVDAGVMSFKIEGRVKSEFYVATIVGAYRRAIDAYLKDPENYVFNEDWYEEILKVSHRDYFEGFINGRFDNGQIQTSSSYIRDYEIVAFVEGYDFDKKMIIAKQRNKFYKSDELELLIPREDSIIFRADRILNENFEEVDSTPHADMKLYIPFEKSVPEYTMIRKRTK